MRRRLDDLAAFVDEADYLVARGEDAYLADSLEGRLLRNAGERILIKVATVVEKLPQEYKDARQEVPWVGISRMRNLVAHHDDKATDELMWQALKRRIPELAVTLGLR